jgi:hypothetical protein
MPKDYPTVGTEVRSRDGSFPSTAMLTVVGIVRCAERHPAKHFHNVVLRNNSTNEMLLIRRVSCNMFWQNWQEA